MTNTNLLYRLKNPSDEFYTLRATIDKELQYYISYFEDKIVYLNCDNPKYSKFFEYFSENFEKLKLKKLISTYIVDGDNISYKTTITKDIQKVEPLRGNGDFRSEECLDILKESDIIVTNPPFSLLKEFIPLVLSYDKDCLILGNMNAICYAKVFPLIKENRLRIGVDCSRKTFKVSQETGETKTLGNVVWFTTFDPYFEKPCLFDKLKKTFSEEEYPEYDEYDAINVNKVLNIPIDYYKIMGVPITYIQQHDKEHFEILGCSNSKYGTSNPELKKTPSARIKLYLDGKEVYRRIFIRRI